MARSIVRAHRSFRLVDIACARLGIATILGACAPSTPSGPPEGGDAGVASLRLRSRAGGNAASAWLSTEGRDGVGPGLVATSDAPSAFPTTLQSGSKSLTLAAARVLVVFRAPPAKATLDAVFTAQRLLLDDGGDGPLPPVRLPITRTPSWFFLRTRDGASIPPPTIAALQADRAVQMVAPVYRRDDIAGPRAFVAVLPTGFGVRLGPEIAPGTAHIIDALGLTIDEQRTRNTKPYAFLSTRDVVANAAHVLAPRLVRALALSPPAIEYEILPLVSGASVTPVDPSDSFYQTSPTGDVEQMNRQWDMKRVGARYAWGSTVGSAAVNAYVIGEGIQQNHPDFLGGAVSQINVDTGGIDAAGLAPLGNSNHDTALAGIMAAGHDDSPPSSAGYAPSCKLISLRGGPNATTISPLTNVIIQEALAFAGSSGVPSVACIGIAAGDARITSTAVQGALSGNPDLLVSVPSGNWSSSGDQAINYTSTGGAYHANLMIVGATQQGTAVPNAPAAATGNDVWKDYGGGVNLGSRNGPELSLVAPGDSLVTLAVPTGYVVGTAQGTSLAAAHVAGLALLVRSKEGALFSAASVRHKIERTCAKTSSEHYTTTVANNLTVGLWNDHMGHGRIDASAVLVHDVDVDTSDLERADVYIRSFRADPGTRPFPPNTDFTTGGDVVFSTNASLVPVGPTTAASAADIAFDAARNAIVSTQIPTTAGITTAPIYVFVRVLNLGPAAARGLRVTAVTTAAAGAYPDDWDALADGMHVPAADDSPSTSYFPGPLPAGGVYVARLVIPTGSSYAAFAMSRGSCLTRVSSTNDIHFARVTYTGSGALPQFNNLMERNIATAQKANGAACVGTNECATGHCVDGVCCDSVCGSQCAACNVAGKMGTCSPVNGPPVGSRAACTATGTTCGGKCDGVNVAACAPGCNGDFVCDTVTQACVPKTTMGATCDGDHTIVGLADGGTQSCDPYKCAGSQCVRTCASTNDCVTPNVCDPSSHCAPPDAAPPSGSGSSGGCAMAHRSTGGGGAWCLALVGLGVGVRRRRTL